MKIYEPRQSIRVLDLSEHREERRNTGRHREPRLTEILRRIVDKCIHQGERLTIVNAAENPDQAWDERINGRVANVERIVAGNRHVLVGTRIREYLGNRLGQSEWRHIEIIKFALNSNEDMHVVQAIDHGVKVCAGGVRGPVGLCVEMNRFFNPFARWPRIEAIVPIESVGCARGNRPVSVNDAEPIAQAQQTGALPRRGISCPQFLPCVKSNRVRCKIADPDNRLCRLLVYLGKRKPNTTLAVYRCRGPLCDMIPAPVESPSGLFRPAPRDRIVAKHQQLQLSDGIVKHDIQSIVDKIAVGLRSRLNLGNGSNLDLTQPIVVAGKKREPCS